MNEPMSEPMNPNYPKQRGCFIDVNDKTGVCTVVDYPTWSASNNRWFPGANDSIPETQESKRQFATKEEALDFCKAENYVVCSYPKSDAELAEIRAKRELYASKNSDESEDSSYEDLY